MDLINLHLALFFLARGKGVKIEMVNPNNLKQKRAALIAEAQHVLDAADREKRSLTTEERASLDRAQTLAKEYGDEIERIESRNGFEMATVQAPRPKELEERDHAFLNFIRKGARNLPDHERRALVEDSQGQFLISPAVELELQRAVASLNPIRQLASKRTVTKDRILVRDIEEASVNWGKLETGTAITESDLAPTESVKYIQDLTGLVKIGQDELMDSDANLLSFITDSFARAIAEKESYGFLKGAGNSAHEPEGATINEVMLADCQTTAAHSAITLEDLMKCVYAVPNNLRQGSAWLFSSVTALAIRQLRAGGSTTNDGPFLWQNSPILGQPDLLCGFPVYLDDNMSDLSGTAAVVACFGNWAQAYRILDRKAVTIQRLDELYAEQGCVGFIVHYRVGGYCIRPSNKAISLLREHSA